MSEKKLIAFNEKEFAEKINPFNQKIIEEFLYQSEQLSDKSIKQYRSSLRIFFTFVHDKLGNLPLYELRPRDGLMYQNYMLRLGLSPNTIASKRYAVSSLCYYIELYYDREYPDFRNIFSKAVPSIPAKPKKEKEPLTMDEFDKIVEYLEKKKDYQKLAYLLFSYVSGARREEVRQLRKEVVNYEKYVNKRGEQKNYYVTHKIRAKGRGKEGKIRQFPFDDRVMEVFKKWLEVRGDDDNPYMFVSVRNGEHRQLHPNTFNYWCDGFSKIIGGKKVFPHLLRATRATSSYEGGKDIKSIQSLLGHESSETTEIYIIQDDDEDIDDLF